MPGRPADPSWADFEKVYVDGTLTKAKCKICKETVSARPARLKSHTAKHSTKPTATPSATSAATTSNATDIQEITQVNIYFL